MRNSHQKYLEYDFGRSRLPADERLADAENRRLRAAITIVLGDPDLPPLAAQTLTEALGSPKCDTETDDANAD